MNIFDGHSDIWENVDEKRARGLKRIIEMYHKPEWEKAGVVAGFYPVWVDPYNEKVTPIEQVFRIIKHMSSEIQEAQSHIRICTSYEDILQANKEKSMRLF